MPSFKKLLKNAGIVFEPRDSLSVFGSYAQGFTMPDAGLILRAVRSPGQTVDQLVDLQPVIADNTETGVASGRDGFDLSASYFWTKSTLGSRAHAYGRAWVIQREKKKTRGR